MSEPRAAYTTDEEQRLLAAARRADRDLAEGGAYTSSEEGLRALMLEAETQVENGEPLDTDAPLLKALGMGWITKLPPRPPATPA
jgi:hypothetical protein